MFYCSQEGDHNAEGHRAGEEDKGQFGSNFRRITIFFIEFLLFMLAPYFILMGAVGEMVFSINYPVAHQGPGGQQSLFYTGWSSWR